MRPSKSLTDCRVIILMGPMGCGKTHIGKCLARKTGWPFYDGDDFHPPANVEKMRAAIALSDEDRRPWLICLKKQINTWLDTKQSSILACSALKQAYRHTLGVDQEKIVTVYLKGSYQLLKSRIADRQHAYMPGNLLRSQLDALEEPQGGLRVDIALRPEEIVTRIMNFYHILETK